MTDRYVLLGLAPPRADWFRAVAHWCHAASIPAEFVKCVSAQQLLAQVASGRPLSAVVVDAAATGVDRDLMSAVRVPVIVVDDGAPNGWLELGATAVLPRRFGPDHLLDTLQAHAARVDEADAVSLVDPVVADVGAPRGRARVVAVCGPGGTGASTVAIALAQGISGSVLLADCKLRAEQAMLHDGRDVVPGVQEVVESFRSRRPSLDEVRRLTFHVQERGYDLLLGLRQPSAWSSLRPRAFEAAFAALCSGWQTVVCDVDADVEGERECGSADVEDRNVMARTVLARADVVLVVGLPGMKGAHSMVRVVGELTTFGVSAGRIVPVLNRAPRSPRTRHEFADAISGLAGVAVRSPVFLPERRVDDVLRDGVRLPPVLTTPLVAACTIEAASPKPARAAGPVRIQPGSLGAWSEG
jgi:hypothetical protein